MLKPYDQKRDNNKVFYNEGCAGRQTANNTPFVHFVDDKIAKKKRKPNLYRAHLVAFGCSIYFPLFLLHHYRHSNRIFIN